MVLRTPVSLHFDSALTEELAFEDGRKSPETPRILVTQYNGDGLSEENKQLKVLGTTSDFGILEEDEKRKEIPKNALGDQRLQLETKFGLRVSEQHNLESYPPPPKNIELKLPLPKERQPKSNSKKEAHHKVFCSEKKPVDLPRSLPRFKQQ